MNFNKYFLIIISGILFINSTNSQIWEPNMKNNMYKNPIIFADYSDPDLIRIDDDFYMVASSFNCMPGIPILHSKDLVNWTIVNHVYDSLPLEKYDKPVHGEGSWAPSIRYHNNYYYVYFCTPHDGLFMASTHNILEKWELTFVENVELWEDPCPFWDDDGEAYLVRSKVCANVLYLHKMSIDGKKLLDNGKLIFCDLENQPTIEGPKLFKKDGYYYIMAPAGGVPTGWQTVLRSKNIYGPYEAKKVLHQGNTDINGPHQGGIVELKSGEWWFVHFQSRAYFGRIVHLQPVKWKDGWPLIGIDSNNDGTGEPVTQYKKPDVGMQYPVSVPQMSDDFENTKLGLQWQWHANPKKKWYSLTDNKGKLRLYAIKNISQNGNLKMVPNLLLQKFPAPTFKVTTRIEFNGDLTGDKAGLIIMGKNWSYLVLEKEEEGLFLSVYEGSYNQCDDLTKLIEKQRLETISCYLRVYINENGKCQFMYSFNNKVYNNIGKEFQAIEGIWIGAKVGLFCVNPNISVSKGYADFEWFIIE